MTSKVTKGHLSFSEYTKILPNTFIYESILIEIDMNTDIMFVVGIIAVNVTNKTKIFKE